MRTKAEREIRLTIAQIHHRKQKRIDKSRGFSIAAVADEAGVSNSTIHNRYPTLVDHIRKPQKEDAKSIGVVKKKEIDERRKKIENLQALLLSKESDLKKLTIENF